MSGVRKLGEISVFNVNIFQVFFLRGKKFERSLAFSSEK